MERLTDQLAIVTGAARGIGEGIARVLASEGARVILCDLDAEAAEKTASSLRERSLDAHALPADVTNRRSVAAIVADLSSAHGRIDIVAANAGIYPVAHLGELDDASWDHILAVNLKGASNIVEACLPTMLARRYGRVVLTSSITGPITGQPGFAQYGATKAAMLGYMRSAAVELALDGITVNAVLPGNVATPGFGDMSADHQRQMVMSIPMGIYADPEDIGWAVRFLAAPEARYITGQTLVVDGGQVLPEAPLLDADPHARGVG
jgi:3-oxoacyl-[acyl-carrier protein] reductase